MNNNLRMENSIGFLGYSINKNNNKVSNEELILLKKELTVKPIENPNYCNPYENSSFVIFRINKNNKDEYYLPRYYGITKFNNQINKFDNSDKIEKINVTFNGTLRELQINTINATLTTYSTYGGGLISLDTGLGKTVVALNLISVVGLKTLIIVHAQFLLEQWIERIKTFLPDARIGVIQQDKCECIDKDIVIGMIQSITKRTYPKEYMKSFGQMIIDEAHHIGSKTFSSIFFKVQTKYMLGLSATPERKDGLSKVIYWFLGPQIVNIKRTTDKPTIQFVVNDCSEYIPKLTRQGMPNIPGMITELTKEAPRNELIIESVLENLKESRKILILSHRREHCEKLLFLLEQKNVNAGLYLGGMKSVNRNESTTKDVIIGTYQASGEGFDVPELDTLILATPKSDIEQAIGRILRQKNNNNPLVIDIVDSFSVFRGQYYIRKKYYSSKEFLINY